MKLNGNRGKHNLGLKVVRWARVVTARRRAPGSDRALATILAGIAGCANAGGFVLLGSYTSHMTGYLSQLADQIVLRNIHLVVLSVMAILLFVLGAASSAFIINWARYSCPRRQYSLPIGIQGLLFFGLALIGGSGLGGSLSSLLCLAILSFIMGFQNATITKISGARIRTTHATGMITDVGIEVGKSMFGQTFTHSLIHGDRHKLAVLLQLLLVFLIGGIVGAFGYGMFAFYFSLPLATILILLALLQG